MIDYAAKRSRAKSLRKQGKSLGEISKILHVAKSSVSLWCRDIKLTKNQIDVLKSKPNGSKLGALANKIKRQNEINLIRLAARSEITPFKADDLARLKDIGAIIYWAEGTKKNVVDITNSDPEMIKIAMNWFREICGVKDDKFRLSIFYHAGQNEFEIKKFWSEITKVPISQFHKSMLKKEGTGHRKNVLYNGTCKIRVHDKDLLYRILTWIEQLYIK